MKNSIKKILLEVTGLILFAVILALVGFAIGIQAAKADSAVIKIAVIDTGFNFKFKDKVKLCSEEYHKDFTKTSLNDTHGHGTNVAGLISKQINSKTKYCLMILKFYSSNESQELSNLERTVLAFNWAIMKGADIINYSGGGYVPYNLERHTVLRALNKGVTVVTAAGNDNKNLNLEKYYPAAYDPRIIVVGNKTIANQKHKTSNYGDIVDTYEVGEKQTVFGITLTGTSQSTAIKTGKIVNDGLKKNTRNPFSGVK